MSESHKRSIASANIDILVCCGDNIAARITHRLCIIGDDVDLMRGRDNKHPNPVYSVEKTKCCHLSKSSHRLNTHESPLNEISCTNIAFALTLHRKYTDWCISCNSYCELVSLHRSFLLLPYFIDQSEVFYCDRWLVFISIRWEKIFRAVRCIDTNKLQIFQFCHKTAISWSRKIVFLERECIE